MLLSTRRLLLAACVLVLHLGALWALQSGLTHETREIIVPAQILSEVLPPPTPVSETSPPPLPTTRTRPTPPPLPMRPAPPLAPHPAPAAPTSATPPAAAQPAQTAPGLALPPPEAASASAVAAPPSPAPAPSPPVPTKVELPSSDAAYLNNPKPNYPALSRRLGEQGRVVVRVLIGVDGSAQQAEIRNSSGFERLDQAALATVRSWRYVPGRRGGIPEAMWFNVPINFILE